MCNLHNVNKVEIIDRRIQSDDLPRQMCISTTSPHTIIWQEGTRVEVDVIDAGQTIRVIMSGRTHPA